VLGTFNVNSGAAIDPTFNGFPPFPFNDCNAQQTIALNLPMRTTTYLGRFEDLRSSEFAAEPNDYYKAIGARDVNGNPTAARGNLDGWKQTHGFSPNPSQPVAGEVRAVYYNDGDLQFGRDMHCKMSSSDNTVTACYVTNYAASGASPGGDPNVALDHAINHPNLAIATVAMENVPILGANAVRFFVFNNSQLAGGLLLEDAELDSEGPKFVPRLCTACHYGDYDPSTKNVNGSSFLPFDTGSFKYAQVNGFRLSDQQEAFRKLNEFVRNTAPNASNTAHDPVRTLIDAWYMACGGVSSPNCPADPLMIPSQWGAGKDTFYNSIVKPDCRGCHMTQPSLRDWTSFAQMSTNINKSIIDGAVCPQISGDHVMPHGEVPFKKMWLSTNPHAPAVLADTTLGLGSPVSCP